MTPRKKHPHIEMPSERELALLAESRTPVIRQLYLDAHSLVLETLPDVVFSVDTKDGIILYGARQYGYDGWGMAALAPYTNWGPLMFIRGTDLDDPDGLLEGTGKRIRHASLRSPEEFRERRLALARIIEAAAQLNRQ